jgi:hypothetical protein
MVVCKTGFVINEKTGRCNKIKVKRVKDRVPIKKRKRFNNIKIKKGDIQLSLNKKEIVLIKKNIKKYKLNLLRNRNIEYQLKNLNSKQRLSFHRKSKNDKVKLQSLYQEPETI